MTATYENIATTTLGSPQTTITFSSIPGTYTDLIIVCAGNMSAGGAVDNIMRFNDDTGSNYSRTYLMGDGSSAVSGRNSNQTSLTLPYWNSTAIHNTIIQINNYSNTTTNKSVLARNNMANESLIAYALLWRSTSAINKITISRGGTNDFATGSTFTLYGIKAE
jgi:hypothetical protein